MLSKMKRCYKIFALLEGEYLWQVQFIAVIATIIQPAQIQATVMIIQKHAIRLLLWLWLLLLWECCFGRLTDQAAITHCLECRYSRL